MDRSKWIVITGVALVVAIVVVVVVRSRSGTPETKAPTTSTSIGGDAGADSGFCRSITDASRAVLARTKVKEPELPPCADGERGGWAFRIDDAIAFPSEMAEGTDDVGHTVVLVHRDAQGLLATYDLPSDQIGDGKRAIQAAITNRNYYGSFYLTSLAIGYIDSDRDPEVFIAGGVAEEGPRDGWTRLLTFKNGQIEPYGPAKGIDIDGARDVDGDGRLDLLTSGPYDGVRAESALGGTYSILDGVLVAHTLPDGTFSLDDSVARAALAKACPNRAFALPTGFLDPEETALAIVCARAWGASESKITKQLASRCASYDDDPTDDDPSDDSICPRVLLDVAEIEPPMTLP